MIERKRKEQESAEHYYCELVLTQKKLPSISMVKMAQANFEEAKITNIEMNSHALLEIAPGIHSPVCPYLVEFSACVPPALHMGMTYDFHIGDLGFYKGPLSHFYQ